MKKGLLFGLFLFFSSLMLIFSNQEIDTIVLLDTSESMFTYFDSSIDYLIKDIIRNQLKQGDTFHLLTFDSKPQYEISRKLKGNSDIEDILSRILLLQPLGKYTDLIAALVYLTEYTKDLSLGSRKKILILTDGIHDPPPDSIYNDKDSIPEKIKEITGNMIRQGWDVSLIRFPLQKNTLTDGNSSNLKFGTDVFEELSKDLNTKIIPYDSDNTVMSHKATGAPLIIFPDKIGKVKKEFTIPFKITNYSMQPIQVKLKGIDWDGFELLKNEVSLKLEPESSAILNAPVKLKNNMEHGTYTIPLTLEFSDDIRPYPRNGTITFILKDTKFSFFTSSFLKIFFPVILIILIIFIIIFIIKKITGSSGPKYIKQTENRKYYYNKNKEENISAKEKVSSKTEVIGNFSSTSSVRNFSSKPHHYEKRVTPEVSHKDFAHHGVTGEKAFELIIDNQNRRIGMRNVHWFKEGSVHSIGGSHSDDFLIFVYPVEKHIAEIEMKDGEIYLNILNKNYFPDIINERLFFKNRNVRLISSDYHSFTIKIKEWISPAERINRILHLIDKPGKPDFTY